MKYALIHEQTRVSEDEIRQTLNDRLKVIGRVDSARSR